MSGGAAFITCGGVVRIPHALVQLSLVVMGCLCFEAEKDKIGRAHV